MSISVGLADTKHGKLMRLTLSGDQRQRAQEEWRGAKVRWAVVGDLGSRYRLVFFVSGKGVKGHEKAMPSSQGHTTYHTYAWSNKDLPDDLALLREQGHDGELCIWEGGSLIIEVRKSKRPKRRACRCSKPKPSLDLEAALAGGNDKTMINILPKKEREKQMKTEAVYQLAKTTPGSLCYTVTEGDLSLGTLYIRKEGPLAKSAPKRIRVTVEAA